MFAWFAGRPDRAALADSETLARWRAEEDEREAAAAAAGDRYYAETALEALVDDLATTRLVEQQPTQQVEQQPTQQRVQFEDSAYWRAREWLKASLLGAVVRRFAYPFRARLHRWQEQRRA